MNDFTAIMGAILNFMKMPINVYGFSFSIWDVMIVSIMASILLTFIVRLFEQ